MYKRQGVILVTAWLASRPVKKSVQSIAVQTKEGGLDKETPKRTLGHAQFQQACQKCWEPILVGDRVSQFMRGWCHSYCDRAAVMPYRHLCAVEIGDFV